LNITRAIKHKIAYDYYLHNTPLEVVDSCKYLGVTVQHDLRWSEQIHNITVKANRTLSFFRRNPNQYLKETAYFSLVRPQLEYACAVWSLAKNRGTKFRETRFVTSTYHRTSGVSNIIDQLRWQDSET